MLLEQERPEDIDLATLSELVQWRHAAFDPEAGPPSWPSNVPDPFPSGALQPPEIAGTQLTAAILAGAIAHHGCLLVRGIIDAEETQRLAEVVGQAFEAAAALVRQGNAPCEASPWYAPYPLGPEDGMNVTARAWGIETGGVWTVDSPRALFHFIEFLKAHGIVRIIEEYLGERAYLSVGKSTLRRVPPSANSAWHQDGAFLGTATRTVNCWLALSDCGEDAPGLEVYPRRLNALAETGTRGAAFPWVVSDEVLKDMAQTAALASPRFKGGDALLFDQMFLHRTGVRPGMTRERLAIESWFFAGSTFPMEQMPIAL
jgi:Phytanoyl-CoA dioxygenase (PhyH)